MDLVSYPAWEEGLGKYEKKIETEISPWCFLSL